jgi:hypothetical protein
MIAMPLLEIEVEVDDLEEKTQQNVIPFPTTQEERTVVMGAAISAEHIRGLIDAATLLGSGTGEGEFMLALLEESVQGQFPREAWYRVAAFALSCAATAPEGGDERP